MKPRYMHLRCTFRLAEASCSVARTPGSGLIVFNFSRHVLKKQFLAFGAVVVESFFFAH